MANDVVIEVEARVGDAIAQMTLTAAAVRALGDAGDDAGRRIGDDSNRRSLSSRLGAVQSRLSNLGDRGPLGMVVRGFGNLASAMLSPIKLGAQFAENFERVGSVGQVLIGTVASLGIGLAGLSAVIFTVVFAAEALASILGTLVAIVADFVAPLTVVASLLGLLGVGFGIAAKRASEGGGKLSAFSKELDKLKSMFGRTSDILAHVFLPYLVELAHAGERALFFFDKIAKMPLKEAFQAIATQGTQLLTKFINRVTEVVSRPIRLSFKLAFGTGPAANEFQSTVSAWWNRFTNYLFGYVERHPLTKLDILKGSKPTAKQVDGIFEPLIEWFNRHKFTEQGIKIGNRIMAGIARSGLADKLGQFMSDVFANAMKQAARAIIPGMIAILGALRRWINAWGQSLDRSLISTFRGLWSAVRSMAVSAWNSISSTIHGIWQRIVNFITSPLHINIDWPSPPSWLSSLPGSGILGGIGGGISGIFHTATGTATGHVATASPRGATGGVTVVQHFHGIDTHTLQGRRQIGAIASRAVEQRWLRSGL